MLTINELISTDVKKARQILRALDHKLRTQLLDRILNMGNKVDVTTLYVHLRIEQSVCSQHLAILRRVGVVTTTRSGKQIFYSVSQDRMTLIDQLCKQMVNNKITEPQKVD